MEIGKNPHRLLARVLSSNFSLPFSPAKRGGNFAENLVALRQQPYRFAYVCNKLKFELKTPERRQSRRFLHWQLGFFTTFCLQFIK
ncbi:MAG: hypothetical protein ACR2J3_07965 [Aridibacter sp.]